MIKKILTLILSRDWDDGISPDALPPSFLLLQSERPKIKKKREKKEKRGREKQDILGLNSMEVAVFRTEISSPALDRGNAPDIPAPVDLGWKFSLPWNVNGSGAHLSLGIHKSWPELGGSGWVSGFPCPGAAQGMGWE